MPESQDDHLHLELIAGPDLDLPPIPPTGETLLGRGVDCRIVLLEKTISRQHASIVFRRGRWLLTDLDSRFGTFVNGIRLTARHPTALTGGDLISIGPWVLRVDLGETPTHLTRTFDDSTMTSRRVERIPPTRLAMLAQQRLSLIVDCAAAITSATTEQALAETALQSAIDGTGFERAALLGQRGGADEVQLLAVRQREGEEPREFTFSRSLIREAASGEMARLTLEDGGRDHNVTLIEHGVTAALCAPIHLGPSVAAYLYLDSRESTGEIAADAATFCQVISRLCGLALSNLKRQELEHRHRRLEADIQAAREAQLLILPSDRGQAAGIAFAVAMRPGRFVAGDLFDVLVLDEDRAGVLIGDVTGHGVGAGVFMAASQAHLHAAMTLNSDPAHAVELLNRYLAEHSDLTRFVSLWVGVFDRRDHTVSFVDAGHGYWMHKPTGGPARLIRTSGGIPLGIEPGYPYGCETFRLEPGDRIILLSDGAIEQVAPEGAAIGHQRLAEAVRDTTSAAEDVAAILLAVETHAGRTDLDDDTTIASIEWR